MLKLRFPKYNTHKSIYIAGLILLVISLPLSRFLLSISQFILVLNWMAEGRFTEKWKIMIKKSYLFIFISIFLLYVIGYMVSDNHNLALIKVKNVLPLLVLPVILATSPPISSKWYRRLLLIFSVAVWLAALICIIHFFLKGNTFVGDPRKISVLIGHTCFALQVNMAIFILLYFFFNPPFKPLFYEKQVIGVLAFLLILFLFFLQSFTGILIFLLTSAMFMMYNLNKKLTHFKRIVLWTFLFSFLAVLVLTGLKYIRKNFHAEPVISMKLDPYTVNGNPYISVIQTGILENGNYTELYVCEPELRKGWNSLSCVPFDSLDLQGQNISETIKRYLTSMGLRKDSAGISQLNKADIQAIEKGITNYTFRTSNPIHKRLYETLWEIDVFKKTGYVQYHSFGQRLVFLQASWKEIQKHWKTGTGTGDVYAALENAVKEANILIDPLWEGKPHNEYMFLLMAFGVFGFIWICLCWIYPVIRVQAYSYQLFNYFTIIVVISMLSFDSLETYDGIVFIAFFYSLFVFGLEKPLPDVSVK
jgi:hypothetical protein